MDNIEMMRQISGLEPGIVQVSMMTALSPLFILMIFIGTVLLVFRAPNRSSGEVSILFMTGLGLMVLGATAESFVAAERALYLSGQTPDWSLLITFSTWMAFTLMAVFISTKSFRGTPMFWVSSIIMTSLSISPLVWQIKTDYAEKIAYAERMQTAISSRTRMSEMLESATNVRVRRVAWIDPNLTREHQDLWRTLTLDVSDILWERDHEPLNRPDFNTSDVLMRIQLSTTEETHDWVCGYRDGELVHVSAAEAPTIIYEDSLWRFCPDLQDPISSDKTSIL